MSQNYFMFGRRGLETKSRSSTGLLLLLKRNNLPSERERELFFSQFGNQHCFIIKSWTGGFKVFSSRATERVTFECLPVDYLYAPDDWERRLTDDQIRNVL